jgi:hypothetical protein
MQIEITRHGQKVKFRFHEAMTPEELTPEALDQEGWCLCFDGTNSWRIGGGDRTVYLFSNVEDGESNKYLGEGLPLVDLYSDAVGLEAVVKNANWTLRRQSPYPFRVDVALATGQYEIVEPKATEGDTHCVVVQRKGLDTIWLDRDRNFALVRRDWCWGTDEPIRVRVRNSDFRGEAPGIWLPREIQVEYFGTPETAPDTLCMTVRVSVKQLEIAPEESFTPPAQSGFLVYDWRQDKEYVIPEDLDFSLAEFAAGEQEFPSSRGPYLGIVSALLLAHVAILAVVLVITLWWRWRRGAEKRIGTSRPRH